MQVVPRCHFRCCTDCLCFCVILFVFVVALPAVITMDVVCVVQLF